MPRYLAGFAEPEARSLAALPLEGNFGHAVVIPACGEGLSLDRAVDSVPTGPLGVVLVLVVVNAREDHPPGVHVANAAALERLHSRGAEPPHRRLLVIDRASAGLRLPPREGVGLARKLGHDVALALHAAGRLRSRFQHATDADALLPADYFERVEPWERASAPPAGLVYPWRHVPDPDPAAGRAIQLYDLWLRFHHLALTDAGSPYAYPSIGSTLAVSHLAYEAVRGFPRRMAGEDFYLLDKLAKAGWIARLGGAPIVLAGRPSDRVPFGTGRSVRDLVARDERAATWRILDPRTYRMLGAWLDLLRRPVEVGAGVIVGGGVELDLAAELDHRGVAAGLTAGERAGLTDALRHLGAFDAMAGTLRLRLDPANRVRRLQTWFDAFRTLKLLHRLRDHGWPALPILEALERAEWAGPPPGGAGWADLEEADLRLRQLEERRCRTPVGLVPPPG